jgi:hypothetical protein
MYAGMCMFSSKRLRHWCMRFETPAHVISFLYQDTIQDSWLIRIHFHAISLYRGVWGWLYGMEMDSCKSQILDGVLVQKWNRTSRCLKLHASVSQFFCTKRTHSRVAGLKGEALFLKLWSFFGVSAHSRSVQICILICIVYLFIREMNTWYIEYSLVLFT